MNRVFTCCVWVCVVGVLAGAAQAGETYTWVGGTSAEWTTASNWTGGTFGTYPDDAGDKAVIETGSPSYWPQLGVSDVEVGVVDLQGGSVTIKDGGTGFRTLTIDNADGLVIASGATLNIEYDGKLILEGGGELAINGNIEFITGTGSLTDDPTLHLLKATAIPDSGAGDIVGTVNGVISAADADAVLILGAGHDINGKFEISAPLVNNGRLVADDTDDKIILTGYAKSGDGDYVIDDGNSTSGVPTIWVKDCPVSGGPGSGLTIDNGGLLDVDYYFVICGELDIQGNGSEINVDTRAMFEISGCP